jgi:hypothetical protein
MELRNASTAAWSPKILSGRGLFFGLMTKVCLLMLDLIFSVANLSSARARIPSDLLALAHDPHHGVKRPSSVRSNLRPDRSEVMKLR